ncbi:MAG: tRNA dihydrouridine synthase DusB [Deltaproteobacteria bacterium]|jgi:nifR3 family TIM-barrel protein|nr:tRNA dihydrouridine synthase DusB [Deltaproteobacteria bacterium]MBW2495810.1 tRNA dihydrouridine synthase DusB [Deltaproteobacteria bacterium]
MDPAYVSDLNRDVRPARPGEFAAVPIGPILADPPVVLAPMAGITNAPFRRLCRRFGAGLYVSEMITARALVERNAKTLRLAEFDPDESPRSLQLYGVDPHYVAEAVRLLTGEDRIDHLDMNFGCPVRKVTRRGGGAAIPAKPRLLEQIVRAAVRAAGSVPVTIKFRMGIDDDWLTFLEAGRIAEAEGCRAVALHARTAAQLYDGEADWRAIAELKQAVTSIPVFGNGDIWEAWDALRMMRETGCDGVVVGRGCLGRPWLFRDLAAVFAGKEPENPPNFGLVMQTMREHARLLCEWAGPRHGIRDFRKHATWYTKGFPGSTKMRDRLIRIESLEELDAILAQGNPELAFPRIAMRARRGKKGGRQRVVLPEGFRNDLQDATPPAAEEPGDGG